MKNISREEAKKKDLKRYFTGIPCKYGHIAERFTSNRRCVECANASKKKQNLKLKKEREKRLSNIKRICKNYTCDKEFTPTRNNQVFCSEICADRQGKKDWKDRNKEIYKKSERERKKRKYENDQDYRESRKIKVSTRYHSLSKEEKRELSRKQRAAQDPDKLKKYHREYFANRIQSDINFLLISNLRTLTKGAIKRGGAKTDLETIKLIGCSLEECREHIEAQFDSKMNWDNWDRDGWHLDHIRPCSSFDLVQKKQQYVCFNWRNLRPLSSEENMSKNNQYSALDEKNWKEHMQHLGYKGELYLLYDL